MNKKTILESAASIWDSPPNEPGAILKQWFRKAIEQSVKEPGALALATTDSSGMCSNRIVQVLDIGMPLIFATHAKSKKGQDIASTGWASGVLYWRETKQQVVLSGPVLKISDQESDTLWSQRPASAYPMSIASQQSAVLEDENELRLRAQKLATSKTVLPRPKDWCGYALHPKTIEFWQAAEDRLHYRLRYDATQADWTHCRLQP